MMPPDRKRTAALLRRTARALRDRADALEEEATRLTAWHDVAAAVKAAREAEGLTQAEFAARHGIALWSLRGYEQGRTRPPAALLAKLNGSDDR